MNEDILKYSLLILLMFASVQKTILQTSIFVVQKKRATGWFNFSLFLSVGILLILVLEKI